MIWYSRKSITTVSALYYLANPTYYGSFLGLPGKKHFLKLFFFQLLSNGLLKSLYNCAVVHRLYNPTNQGQMRITYLKWFTKNKHGIKPTNPGALGCHTCFFLCPCHLYPLVPYAMQCALQQQRGRLVGLLTRSWRHIPHIGGGGRPRKQTQLELNKYGK